MRLVFADCVLDLDTRELRRGGSPVALAPQAFRLLELLVHARPRPLRHEALRDALWPDTHVSHTALPRVVSELRDALGDSGGRGSIIRTVPRFGYAFAAVIAPPDIGEAARAGAAGGASAVEWLLLAGDREFLLPQGETVVGRGLECTARLASLQVSRIHARVRVAGEVVTLEDCGSKNGTWVNGARLARPVTVGEADDVRFGLCSVAFRRVRGDASTRSAASHS
jgi:DNA-binding winged helix-turn-helix (wHTH) protein